MAKTTLSSLYSWKARIPQSIYVWKHTKRSPNPQPPHECHHWLIRKGTELFKTNVNEVKKKKLADELAFALRYILSSSSYVVIFLFTHDTARERVSWFPKSATRPNLALCCSLSKKNFLRFRYTFSNQPSSVSIPLLWFFWPLPGHWRNEDRRCFLRSIPE